MFSGYIEYFQQNTLAVLFILYIGFKIYQSMTQEPFNETEGPAKIKNLVEFQTLLAENPNKIVVIDFYAVWCGPCKVCAPKYAKLSEDSEFQEVIFRKCNVDEAGDVSKACGVKAMPTFKIFLGPKEIGMFTGYNEEKLKDILRNAIKSN